MGFLLLACTCFYAECRHVLTSMNAEFHENAFRPRAGRELNSGSENEEDSSIKEDTKHQPLVYDANSRWNHRSDSTADRWNHRSDSLEGRWNHRADSARPRAGDALSRGGCGRHKSGDAPRAGDASLRGGWGRRHKSKDGPRRDDALRGGWGRRKHDSDMDEIDSAVMALE